jgi:RIO kinase 1
LYFGRFAPELKETRYAREMWSHFEAGTLSPATVLTGVFVDPDEIADVGSVLREMEAARLDDARRQAARMADDAPPNKTEEPPPPWMQ